MNYKLKIRISIMLCFALIAFSIQPLSVGAASIGEPVPTDVSYWSFDENTTSSILNQGYNNILCLWDFENHEYLLVKCPDHMYYVPGGIICIDGDYTGLFDKTDYQNYIRDQIIYSWGKEKGYFNLSASQYFTVYRVSEDGTLNYSEVAEFNGIVNGTAWNFSKTKYNALRWLYENDLTVYNSCNYALCWATDSIEYAYAGSGNASIDLYHWATGVLLPGSAHTEMSFTGGSTLNAAESDIPVYVFYPGGFNFTSPVAPTPTPEASPVPTPLGELPTFTITSNTEYIDQCTLVVKCTTSGILNGYAYSEGNYYAVGADYANNPWYYYYVKSRHSYYTLYGGVQPYSINNNGNFDMVFTSGIYSPRVFSIAYDLDNNIITSGINTGATGKCDLGNNSYGYHCFANYFPIENIETWFDGQNNINIVDTARFELVACNNGVYRGNGDLGTSTPTPSPTSSPTPTPYAPAYVSPTPSPAPSPGVTVIPTSGPTETSVKELHGWKGALQKILQSVFIGNTDAIANYFKDAVAGYNIVNNPFQQIVDSIYVEGSDQDNYDPFDNQMVDFVFDVHDQNGEILGGEHTTNWRLTILPKTFWEWLKSYSNYFEIVFYMVDASFLGATMKRWLTKQNDEGSESKDGD